MFTVKYIEGFGPEEHDGVRPFRWMSPTAVVQLENFSSRFIKIPYAVLSDSAELVIKSPLGTESHTLKYGWNTIIVDLNTVGQGKIHLTCSHSQPINGIMRSLMLSSIVPTDVDASLSMYARAGITDIAAFYQEKFSPLTKASLPTGIDCYCSDSLKKMWIFSNIRPGSRVLDFGCGSGSLGFLKKKNCYLVGIDYSERGIQFAITENGYDAGVAGNLESFSWEENFFDYIVSLDVFGHITFEEKEHTISSLKKYLKKDGIMLHGIECGPFDYDGLSFSELKKFVEVDGHVGIESKKENYQRFLKFFKHVDGEVRYTMMLSAKEYKKQSSMYQHAATEKTLVDYINGLTPSEAKAFDVAAGLSQIALDVRHVPSADTDGGFLFLRASDAPLPPLTFEVYHEAETEQTRATSLLESKDIFVHGWYGIEENTISGRHIHYRFGQQGAQLTFRGYSGRSLKICAFSYITKTISETPEIYFINTSTKECIKQKACERFVQFELPLTSDEVTFICGSTFAGIPLAAGASDDCRSLSIAICEISVE